ncbi:TLDc domain-containing protein [Entamoeba marina]
MQNTTQHSTKEIFFHIKELLQEVNQLVKEINDETNKSSEKMKSSKEITKEQELQTIIDNFEKEIVIGKQCIAEINEIENVTRDIVVEKQKIIEQVKMNEKEEKIIDVKQPTPKPIQIDDFQNEIEIMSIGKSLSILENWCNLSNSNIVYDSDRDNIENKTLINKIIGRDNLYFINFDDEGNIFGGFIHSKITATFPSCMIDPNAFVFSLSKNGIQNPKRFMIHKKYADSAFWLNSEDGDYLYCFGNDVFIFRIGDHSSYCGEFHFDYEGISPALTNKHGWRVDQRFSVERIVVIQMS